MSAHFDDLPPESIPAGPGAAGETDDRALVSFDIDLTLEEARRRAEVVAALGADWDPVEALRGEEAAYALLYSGLDDEQQRIYRELVEAGVLPERGGGSASH